MTPSLGDLGRSRPSGSTVEIVLPVYNEEKILEEQIDPVRRGLPDGFSMRLVENGSTDSTAAILDVLSGAFPALTVVNLPSAQELGRSSRWKED